MSSPETRTRRTSREGHDDKSAPLVSARSEKLSRRATRFGKERRLATTTKALSPAPSPGAGGTGTGSSNNANNHNDNPVNVDEVSSPSRTFQVRTERGGKRLMSEDEVSSLVHSALLRARQATSSFSPRARSSRPFAAERMSPASNASSASPTKAGGGGGGGSLGDGHENQRSVTSSPSYSSSRPPPYASSSSISPRNKQRASLSASGLYVPRDEEIQTQASLSRRSSGRSAAASPSYHSARTSKSRTPHSRGDDSIDSFGDFHTPSGIDGDRNRHSRQGDVELDFGSCNLSSANLSMTSTDEGMEIEEVGSGVGPSISSVNSSEAIIRRVEEEIANARRAAQEANRRLAGVSANLKEAGGAPATDASTSFDGKESESGGAANYGSTTKGHYGGSTSSIQREAREPPPFLSAAALLAMDDDDGHPEALFDSAMNVIGEEFDMSSSIDAGFDREEDADRIMTKLECYAENNESSDDETSAEDMKWLAELGADTTLETTLGSADQLRLIAAPNIDSSVECSLEPPYSPDAPDDEKRWKKPTGREGRAFGARPIHGVTGKAPASRDKDMLILSASEEIDKLLKDNDSFGEAPDPCLEWNSQTTEPRLRSIDGGVATPGDLAQEKDDDSTNSEVKVATSSDHHDEDDNRVEESEEHEEGAFTKTSIDEIVGGVQETSIDNGHPSETEDKTLEPVEAEADEETQISADEGDTTMWYLINDSMEEKKSDDSLHLPIPFEDDAPLDESMAGTEAPVAAENLEGPVVETSADDILHLCAEPGIREADEGLAEEVVGARDSDPSVGDVDSDELIPQPVAIDDDGATADEEANEKSGASIEVQANAGIEVRNEQDCNHEPLIPFSTDLLKSERMHDGSSEAATQDGAHDIEIDLRNDNVDVTPDDAGKDAILGQEDKAAHTSETDGTENAPTTEATEAQEAGNLEQVDSENCDVGNQKEKTDPQDECEPLDGKGDEDEESADDEEDDSQQSVEKQQIESERDDLEEEHYGLDEELPEEPGSQEFDSDKKSFDPPSFTYQVISPGSDDAVATARAPLPQDDSGDESDDIQLKQTLTFEIVLPDEVHEGIEIVSEPFGDVVNASSRTNESASDAGSETDTTSTASNENEDDVIEESEEGCRDSAEIEMPEQRERENEKKSVDESHPTDDAWTKSSTRNNDEPVEHEMEQAAGPEETPTGSAAQGPHDDQTELGEVEAESAFDGLDGEADNNSVRVGDNSSNIAEREVLSKADEERKEPRREERSTAVTSNTEAVQDKSVAEVPEERSDENAHVCPSAMHEGVTPLAGKQTIQIPPSPNNSVCTIQTPVVASSPRRAASPVPSPRRVALVENRRALQSRADEARKAMCGEPGGTHALPDPAKDIVSRAKKVKFKQMYPVPPQMKRLRHPSEIIMEHRTEAAEEKLFYSKPKKDLKELLEAATGPSFPRRSNACGALKVLSTQKKNKLTLVRTLGFLDAIVFAISDNFSAADSEAGVAARTRAASVVVNVAEMKDNRYHVFSHRGLADSLVKCMVEDEGEGRAAACAALATLAKTAQCRDSMASTENLVDVLAIIMKGDEPSMYKRRRQSSSRGKKQDSPGEDDGTQTRTNSFDSSSSSDNTSVGRESPSSQVVEARKRARLNACAALLHLSKECSVSPRLCASGTLLSCLVATSTEFDNAMHTKVLEIFCNLTRFLHNNVTLVKYPGLVDSLIANGKLKNDDDRMWSMRSLQNLSTEPTAKSILANRTVLELLSVNMMRHQEEEQRAATAAIYNLSTEPGAVVPLTNTRNVVATLVHVAHSPTSSSDVRLMACDTLATLGLWLQTLAGAGTVPDGVNPVPLPTYVTSGWNRWEA
jgi:hypothetical protein